MAEKNNEYHFAHTGRVVIIRARSRERAEIVFMEKYSYYPELIKSDEDLKY